MTQQHTAVNDLMDLVRNNRVLNLNAREITPFYAEGRVDFDTVCCWNHQRINQIKRETRIRLNLDVLVKSKLRSHNCFPSRRVRLEIRYYPNIQPRHPYPNRIQRTLGPEDEDELGW